MLNSVHSCYSMQTWFNIMPSAYWLVLINPIVWFNLIISLFFDSDELIWLDLTWIIILSASTWEMVKEPPNIYSRQYGWLGP